MAKRNSEWSQSCIGILQGRIPIDDLYESPSEGEGACSESCAGRSHLPLRGKLGWMTPRPGQKKAGNGMRLWGSRSQARAPLHFPSPDKSEDESEDKFEFC